MATKSFDTLADLREWVWDHVGSDVSDGDVEGILQVILDDEHPEWGHDWTAYLDALPEYLVDLLPPAE